LKIFLSFKTDGKEKQEKEKEQEEKKGGMLREIP
jgi:hypothetical protein